MATKELAMHEKLEVHELLTLKVSCATKAVTMLELAKDEKLKDLISEDIKETTKAIKDLKSLLK